MPPVKPFGRRPDRTPVYLTLGLVVLALLGWMVWALGSPGGEGMAVSSRQLEREVRLEARRQLDVPMLPSTPSTPTPPTTGPNGPVGPDPVLGDGGSATEMAAAPPADGPDVEDLEQLATRMREDLLELRKSFTAFQTRPGQELTGAREQQMRNLEIRVHELEQRVNSLQSSGSAQIQAVEDELQGTLDRIRTDFDNLRNQSSG